MNSTVDEIIDKTIVLDSCVDGDETRFGNLVGKDYDRFNLIYDIIKRNKEKIRASEVMCDYVSDTQLKVIIPTMKRASKKTMDIPPNDCVDVDTSGNQLILNITVKKER